MRVRATFLTSLSMKLATAIVAASVIGVSVGIAAASSEHDRYQHYLERHGVSPSTAFQGVEVAPAVSSLPLESQDAPQAIVEADRPTWKLNHDFVASQDEKLDGCVGPKSRFCKIKPSLLPIYEQVSRETGVPAALMYATGEYETHNVGKLGDGGKSCGIFQFWGWRKWGFASLDACLDPETNIRKFAESWQKNHNGNTRAFLCRHNGGVRGCRIPAAATYADRVMKYAEELYAPQA